MKTDSLSAIWSERLSVFCLIELQHRAVELIGDLATFVIEE